MQFASGIDTPDLSKVTSMERMFFGCTSFNQPLNSWDVSKVTYMSNMFSGCTSFNQPLNSWDVSKVTYMSNMFSGCTSFNQPLNSWDVSKVTYMSGMFSGCASFNQPLNNWDVSQVTCMSGMFSGCASFNQPLNNWNVSKVTDMNAMFSGCTSFNKSLNSWDVSQVTNMRAMFDGCASFNLPLNNWNVSQVTDMAYMFSYCSSFNQNLGMWKLEKCEDLDFDNCGMSEENYSKSLVGWASQANIKQGLHLNARGLKYNASGKAARKKLIESKKWSISDIVDENDRPFITRWKGEVGKVLQIPIRGKNFKLVIKMSDGTVLKTEPSLTMTNYESYKYTPFKDGELLIEAGPEGIRSFNFRENASAEALLRVEQFGTVQWQTMQDAFYGCKNMQFTDGIDSPALRKVTSMGSMFSGCTSFNQPLNSWDVSKVTYMGWMFSGCTSFNQPLNNWDVSTVWSMEGIFRGCSSFNQELGMWKLEECKKLGLDNCGMSAENYSKSLEGWAAQNDIDIYLTLDATGLKYFLEAAGARAKLINSKRWRIEGDVLVRHYLSFEEKTRSLTKGAVHTLVLTKKGIDENETVMLTSSAPTTVRIIDATSLTIKGLKTGKATITATVAANGSHEKLVATCEVFVTIPVSGVTLSQTELPLVKGATAKLTATVSPTDATNKKVRWSSTNTAVATVENGIVTAVSGGNATITVTTEEGNHTARCEVTVTVSATGVTLSQTKLSLAKGATATLTATVVPADATNKKVTWRSNNTSIATVENGTVTAVSGGNVTITVTTEDGNHTVRCEVTVTVSATGVTFLQTELPLVKGATATLSATVVPADATNKQVTWSSTNTAVAIVENGTVTAVSGGAATITVTTEDGNHTATCEVTVTVPVTGVTLSQTELPLLKGATAGLTATVSPPDATNQKVTWSSNNTAVATVENGTVTAVSAGNATITVTTEDGNHTARCEVTVTVSATGVTLSQTELSLAKGAKATLRATVVPSDATNQKVRWSSNNTSIATVENGTVTAVSGGNATITVTTEDGNHTARCEVVVTDPIPVSGVTLSQTELSLVKGTTATLTATVAPSDATNQKVTWRSNNTSVATVENGTVTAVSAGNASITVTTEDGNHTATCSVAVEATSAVEDAVFASVVVSPNPFGKQLCITYGDLRGQYVLYNAQGVVVVSGGLEDGETRINTVSFTAGVYLLRLTAENGATKNYTVVKD